MKNENYEEKLLKSYARLINWGVRKFLPKVKDRMSAEDIRQEGRVVVLKLSRDYDKSIGTLDGYIKSLFYKMLRNRLKIDRKRVEITASNEIEDYLEDKALKINENLIEKIFEIRNSCTDYEFKKLMDYANGKLKYIQVKSYIQKVKRNLER
jgi:DNA-directed RNA polymerase specialized sigma24 family protein